MLATILFTDIVGSTAKAVELGDRGWRELVERHHALVRGQLARYPRPRARHGRRRLLRLVRRPRARDPLRQAIVDGVRELGIEVRAGLHTGECEVMDGKVGGIAVHIGARVAAQAEPGEVLVSSTVKDLVAGSGLEFETAAPPTLKGVPGRVAPLRARGYIVGLTTPIRWPSGSVNRPSSIVSITFSGPITRVPPRLSALARAASTSWTPT